jgi:tetratricopeptide (TPR) repeat protein
VRAESTKVAKSRASEAELARQEGIRVSESTTQARLNPLATQAYAQLQSGNLQEARASYSKLTQAEPLNADALLGLAYIAAQENRTEDATKLYLRILQLNPRHAAAQGALIGLVGRADPAASETRLKQLIAREPSAFLHFILGNLYADQSMWSQAQQSYFQAHHLEPDNPDYAYNLAVGLDHLRQSKLALNFYRRAEQLAASQGRANFNLSHARERISALNSQLE